MQIFIATLSTETNSFCTMPTAMSGFEEYYLRFGTATQDPPNLMTEALHVWRRRAEALHWNVVESIAAIAEPAGPTVNACYVALRDRILDDLRDAGGADVILLQLHGAMIAEGVDDCEGDLITLVRQICPDAVIGVALDLHCHVTEAMLNTCDLMICFKEYPHDDATARAEELFDLAVQTRNGQIAPKMAMFDCRMNNLFLTKSGAMRRFVDRLSAFEKEPGILSVSLSHGFPWGDVEDVGARLWVVSDGDSDLARQSAETLGREFYDLRAEVADTFPKLSDALDQAMATDSTPVVLADMGDNSGGGAPGDATFMLRAMMDRKLENVALGIIWDPGVVRICLDAGVGASLSLRLGGKTSRMSGEPVDIDCTVMAIKDGLGQHLGVGLEPLGRIVWLRTGDRFDILVNDLRTQVYHPEAFEQLGIDLSAKAFICVKSLFHFYAPFAKIASRVIQVATPGGTCPDFTAIPLTKRKSPYWPMVDDPFAD